MLRSPSTLSKGWWTRLSSISKAWGRHATPPTVDVAAQIAKDSYLGHAFKEVWWPRKWSSSCQKHDDSSESLSMTEESSTEESLFSSELDNSSPLRDRRMSQLAHQAKKWKLVWQKKTLIKPVPPMEYNRSPNSHTFHCFMMEGKVYLEDSQVPRSSQVRILARHLKGKAHNFYMCQVSDQPREWRLSRFLT